MYDVLRGCVGDTIAEYGVIEHRFSVAAPETYEYLVKHYGHTAIAPSKYTASAFLGGALGRAARREDLVAGIWVPATGYWSYNGRVGAYATAKPSRTAVTSSRGPTSPSARASIRTRGRRRPTSADGWGYTAARRRIAAAMSSRSGSQACSRSGA